MDMVVLGRLRDGVRDRIRPIIRDEHLRTWDRNGGPGAGLRLAMRRPLLTAVVAGAVTAAVLVATFGVPPFSPLALIVLVVAPIPPWLRAERSVYDEWLRRAAPSEPTGDAAEPTADAAEPTADAAEPTDDPGV